MNALIWIHDVFANSCGGEKILAGDTVLCSIVGILIGCCIGPEQLRRTPNQDNG